MERECALHFAVVVRGFLWSRPDVGWEGRETSPRSVASGLEKPLLAGYIS